MSARFRRPRWIIRLVSFTLIGGLSILAASTANLSPQRVLADEKPATPSPKPTDEKAKWISLFDGKKLDRWKSTRFGGEGDVIVRDGSIVLEQGHELTGITWQKDPPVRVNYEITLEAQRVDGTDFFCALTFPVKDDYCSLVVGGWAGSVVGISSVDGNDASENETASYQQFENGRWYRVTVRVTDDRVSAWIDDKQVVNLPTKNRKLSVRGEVNPSRPLGIASYSTVAQLRDIRVRKLDPQGDEPPKDGDNSKQ